LVKSIAQTKDQIVSIETNQY